MWKRLVILSVAISIGLFPVTALAATTQNVTITATPGYGIVSFSIDYISETQMDLSWVVADDVVNVMVRAKYGEDLDEIPNEDTDPSDGYLVYEGAGSSVSDTSLNFDENPGPLYYKIWGQKADNKWYVGSMSDWEESAIMTLLGFIFLCGIMSYISLRNTYYPLKFLAGLCWWAFCLYWIGYRPSAITQGSPTDTGVIVLLFAFGVAMMLFPFWYPKLQDGREVGGRLRFPFMRSDEQEEEAKRQRSLPTRSERTSAYLDRLNKGRGR